MVSNVEHVVFSKETRGGGPGGPDGSDLARRVVALEVKIDRIDGALARLEPAVREIAVDNRKQFVDLLSRIGAVEARLAGVEGQMEGVKGRLALVPTTWQIIAILATLLIGIAGIIFTASRFLHS